MNLQTPYEVLSDPAASNWLKDSLRAATRRDPLDAANDAEWLAEYLKARLDHIERMAGAVCEARS